LSRFGSLCAIRYNESVLLISLVCFFLIASPTNIYTLSLHDALPIFAIDQNPPSSPRAGQVRSAPIVTQRMPAVAARHSSAEVFRSEEHTSELQSRENLVCRLLLEKKKIMRLALMY